jgi:hypothetical protein
MKSDVRFKINVCALDNGEGWRREIKTTENKHLIDAVGQVLTLPTIRRAGGEAQSFPIPGDEPDAGVAPEPHGELWSPADGSDPVRVLQEALAVIMARSPNKGDVARFGRYLFDTLIGRTAWTRMKEIAGADTIELMLAWRAEEESFNRLTWEMMHDSDNFLAQQTQPRVTIARVVAGTRATIKSIASPPRVLFVVGSHLNDPVIRLGTEYLGLLRNLKHTGEGATLKTHLLLEATPRKLEGAIRSLRPDVLHLCRPWHWQRANRRLRKCSAISPHIPR